MAECFLILYLHRLPADDWNVMEEEFDWSELELPARIFIMNERGTAKKPYDGRRLFYELIYNSYKLEPNMLQTERLRHLVKQFIHLGGLFYDDFGYVGGSELLRGTLPFLPTRMLYGMNIDFDLSSNPDRLATFDLIVQRLRPFMSRRLQRIQRLGIEGEPQDFFQQIFEELLQRHSGEQNMSAFTLQENPAHWWERHMEQYRRLDEFEVAVKQGMNDRIPPNTIKQILEQLASLRKRGIKQLTAEEALKREDIKEARNIAAWNDHCDFLDEYKKNQKKKVVRKKRESFHQGPVYDYEFYEEVVPKERATPRASSTKVYPRDSSSNSDDDSTSDFSAEGKKNRSVVNDGPSRSDRPSRSCRPCRPRRSCRQKPPPTTGPPPNNKRSKKKKNPNTTVAKTTRQLTLTTADETITMSPEVVPVKSPHGEIFDGTITPYFQNKPIPPQLKNASAEAKLLFQEDARGGEAWRRPVRDKQYVFRNTIFLIDLFKLMEMLDIRPPRNSWETMVERHPNESPITERNKIFRIILIMGLSPSVPDERLEKVINVFKERDIFSMESIASMQYDDVLEIVRPLGFQNRKGYAGCRVDVSFAKPCYGEHMHCSLRSCASSDCEHRYNGHCRICIIDHRRDQGSNRPTRKNIHCVWKGDILSLPPWCAYRR